MMASHPYRAILLTANQLRHAYIAAELANRLELVGVISEAKAPLLEATADGERAQADREVLIQHLDERRRAEEYYFGATSDLPAADSLLRIDHGTLNTAVVYEWIQLRKPDVLLLFGSSILREPLLSAYPDRIVNMHLGLSPYYRGSGTNFWPLVNNQPECVGVTIHLASSAVDAGPILCQGRPTPTIGDNAHTLGCKAIVKGASLLASAVVSYLDGRLRPVAQTGGGRVYRRRDFSAAAVRQMWQHFHNGMIESYLSAADQRRARYPIIDFFL
jgi:methionyl-tRNA formyltransferase